MLNKNAASNIIAPTRFLDGGKERYAYRRFGAGPGLPLLCLQHFTGTMDNWDPAVTDPLASEREVILFESAGIGRSSGSVPKRSPAWPRMPWRSSMVSVSGRAMFWVFR
jgi:pimeloyl-ACP methyl ester carboxylesterase